MVSRLHSITRYIVTTQPLSCGYPSRIWGTYPLLCFAVVAKENFRDFAKGKMGWKDEG